MANHRKTRTEEVDHQSRRKKSSRQHEVRVMKAPGEESALHGPTVDDPVALLTSPEMGHPANAPLRAQAMADLQRQRGNTYVQRLIRSGAIQAKLTVSPPDDAYEREADRVAEQVMRVPEPQLRRQVEPEEEEEEEEPIEMKRIPGGTPQVSPELEGRIRAQKGGGQALDSKVRDHMESALGADFSRVRVHTDAEADSLAKDLRARAFTTGKDIFFHEGSYQPGSDSGNKLIGHELTHVLQQSGVVPAAPPMASDRSEQADTEADAPRTAALTRRVDGALSRCAPDIQRIPDEEARGRTRPAGAEKKGGAALLYLAFVITAIHSARSKGAKRLYYPILRSIMEGLWVELAKKVVEHRRHLLALACMAKAAGPGGDPLAVARFCKTYKLPLTLPVVGLIPRIIGKLDITRAVSNAVKLIGVIVPILESIRLKNAVLIAGDRSVVPIGDTAAVGEILETATSPKEVIDATKQKASEVATLKSGVERYAVEMQAIEAELGIGEGTSRRAR